VSKDPNDKGRTKWVQSHLGPTEKRKSKKVDSSKDPAQSLLLNRKLQEVIPPENPKPCLSREVKLSAQVVGPSPEEPKTRSEDGNKLKEWKRIARGSPKVAKGDEPSPLRGAIDNPVAFERYESLAIGEDSVLAVASLQPRQSPIAMNLLSWNCRGLGNPQTVRELRRMVKIKHPLLLFLMETKVSIGRLQNLRLAMGFEGLLSVDPVGRSGGLALFWKGFHLVELLSYSRRHISVSIRNMVSGVPWKFTGFYGHLDPA